MAQAPQSVFAQTFQGFNLLGGRQKIGLIIGAAAVIALASVAWMWAKTPDYRILFSNLSDKDGGAIITALQQQNIPYKMAEGGGAIMVPSDQVYDVRLRLASQGLPRGGAVGFELMENQKLGTSQFVEQVNYQRALEGELARSITALSAVQGARVHLAIPRPSVFLRDQQKPSASVLLSLFPGRGLEASQVNGITHLVSSSVPDMPTKNVTVIDQNGNLLSRPSDAASRAGLDASQLEYLQQVEQSYIKRIEAILTPLTGPGNVRAQVAADLDFAQVEQTAEIFKPNPTPGEAAVRSEQSREILGGSNLEAKGVPGALSNQPPGAASAPITAPAGARPAAQAGTAGAPGSQASISNSQKDVTTNYEVDKTIRHMKQHGGTVKRLSVAVVVNNKKSVSKDGKVSTQPMTAAELTNISNLVKEAVGYSMQRGDTLNVVNAAFSSGDEEPVKGVPFYKEPGVMTTAKEVARYLIIGGLIFFLVYGVLRPLLQDLAKAGRVRAAALEAEEAREHGGPVFQAPSYEESLRSAKELAKQEPRIVASVVKEWVGSKGE